MQDLPIRNGRFAPPWAEAGRLPPRAALILISRRSGAAHREHVAIPRVVLFGTTRRAGFPIGEASE